MQWYRTLLFTSDLAAHIKNFFIFADINECATNPCHADGTCTNTPGTFQCACNQGYTGNGFVCLSM